MPLFRGPSFAALVFVSATAIVSGACGKETPASPPTPAPTATPATGPTPAGPPGFQNEPPHAVFSTRPEADRHHTIRGRSPFTVHFNMCASSDPEKDPLFFTHDFDGDGVDDRAGYTGADCRRTFTYVFTASVKVQRFEPRQCVVDRDRDTGTRLHDRICASYIVEVRR